MGFDHKLLGQILARRVLPILIFAVGGIGAIIHWFGEWIMQDTGTLLLSISALLLLGYLFGPPIAYRAARVWRKLTPRWDEIAEALHNGTNLYYQPVRNEVELDKWTKEWRVWTYGTADLIQHTCGKPVSRAFIARPQVIPADITGSFNQTHNLLRLQLSKRLEVLNRLLEKEL
jgi:hypothetical protein